MFRNQYDTDITTWSPTGRLYQVEYASEAVNQGFGTVGLKSKDYVVIAALKRSPSTELSSYQEKIFHLDDSMGMGITGLIADGRVLARFIRTECMNHRYMRGASLPMDRMIQMLTIEHQDHTHFGGHRPFGVGLLIAGYDRTGTRLFQTSPSGDAFDVKATAMGMRSQTARTYLERHFETFHDLPLHELVTHALKALVCVKSESVELNVRNTTIAIVGKDHPFTIYSGDSARQFLDGFQMRPEDVVAPVDAEEERDDDVYDAPVE